MRRGDAASCTGGAGPHIRENNDFLGRAHWGKMRTKRDQTSPSWWIRKSKFDKVI